MPSISVSKKTEYEGGFKREKARQRKAIELIGWEGNRPIVSLGGWEL